MKDISQNLVLGEYAWILVVGSFAAFIFGFGTGSNDVANAFGTSVGAKTITLKTAVLIAIVFEFTGALVLGRVSQETISGGLADIGAFTSDPEFYAYGMMWALLVGGVWQIAASYMELNVSATHSIIGAIVGFTMTYKGRNAVIWAQQQVVCTGPLTGFNDQDDAGAMMFFTPVGKLFAEPLAASYTVPMEWVYNVTTGASMSMINAAFLTNMTGIQILNGGQVKNATWNGCDMDPSIPGATCPFAGQTSAGTSFSGNGGPYIANISGYPYGSVQFTLKTANHPPGKPWECGGLNCPIFPATSAPIVPGQWYYGGTGGYCTTASNAALPFPPYKGVLIIVLSWFFSPVLTGIASSIIYLLSRTLVLRHPNAYKRSFFVMPIMSFLTFWVNIYFVLTKGAAKILSRDAEGWTVVKAAWISAACAGGVSFLSVVVVVPLVYMRINKQMDDKKIEEDAAANKAAQLTLEIPADPEKTEGDVAVATSGADAVKGYLAKARNAVMHGMEVNIHDIVEEDELVAAIHAHAEVFDEKAELVFSYMQVFSAICVIFAHGAGEVGYMSGPLGAIFSIIRSGTLASSSNPPMWTILIGALGLIIGLGTYGYSVTRAVGTRLAKLTASRGFAAELSTSMIIMIAAQYGLPTSSSQCITGGIIGIALCEGRRGLNAKFLFSTFMSWVWTMLFVALITGFFFAQGAYAPSAQMNRQLGYYEEALSARSNLLLKTYQTMLAESGYNTASTSDLFSKYLAQSITNTNPGQYFSYQPAPSGYYPGNKAPVIQTSTPFQMVSYLDTALALLQMSVVPKATGINMCGGTNNTINNYATLGQANFPWSVKATTALAIANVDPSIAGNYTAMQQKLGLFGSPCTGTGAKSSFSSLALTKATFVGPSFRSTIANEWVDKSGNLVLQYNGSYGAGFELATPGTIHVGLDQVANWKTCQQAPCNQAYWVLENMAYNG